LSIEGLLVVAANGGMTAAGSGSSALGVSKFKTDREEKE
jgi:hypothetical protein